MTLASAKSPEAVARAYEPFALVEDPYPFAAMARRATPLFRAEEIDHWVVTRYADIKTILLDHQEAYSAANTIAPIHPLCEDARRVLADGGWGIRPALGNNDPPDHTRFRSNVHRAFTPRRVALLEPFIRERVDERINRIVARGETDLMAALVSDLPALVILELVGVGPEHMQAIKDGSELRVLFVWGRPTPRQQTELAHRLVDFWRLLRALVDARLGEPRDDLTSALLEVRRGDDTTFSLDEIASVLFAFFTAGHETTASLIGNAVHQLLRQRGAWRRLGERPDEIPNAVEETLRFDTSVITWRRRTKRAVEIGGVTVPGGEQLLLLLASANHDEKVFDASEEFRIDRPNARQHLAFGHGIHHCIGASLARLEARVVIERLTQRLPGLSLAPDARFTVLPNTTFRGPRALPVVWEAD